jgi:cytoskeletal protein RodZ
MSSSARVTEKEASLGHGGIGKNFRETDTTLTLPQRPPIFAVTGKLRTMTKGTFGDSLKREREMRGVSLDEISAATRIATRFLQAIENEQWDQLPGGVFNRGFVRAVAHYLGLDEENIVAEYALAVNDRPTVPVWTGSPPKVTPDRPWLAWGLAAVVVVLLAAGGWLGTRRILAWRTARRAAQSAALSVTAAPISMPTPPAGVPSVAPENIAPSTVAASEAPPEVPPAPVSPEPATPATPPVSTFLELKVQAVKKTKLTIEADGNQVFDETMKAGENHVFEASEQFNVSAHDAGALMLELNGKSLAPIGPSGHAGKVTLTREALKGAAGGGN